MKFGKCCRATCSSAFVVGAHVFSAGVEEENQQGGQHLNTWLLLHSWLCVLRCLTPSQTFLGTVPTPPPQERQYSTQKILFPF